MRASRCFIERPGLPALVIPRLIKRARTYRHAVRWCWRLRRLQWTNRSDLGRIYGFTRQHVGDWINPDDNPRRRSLPGDCVERFEEAMGNSFVSQWHALRAQLTVAEEAIADRQAERAAA